MTALIPTCCNCPATDVVQRNRLTVCLPCWTVGGLIDDKEPTC